MRPRTIRTRQFRVELTYKRWAHWTAVVYRGDVELSRTNLPSQAAALYLSVWQARRLLMWPERHDIRSAVPILVNAMRKGEW